MHEDQVATYGRVAQRLVDAVQALSRAKDVESIQAIVRVAARALTGADGATFVLRDGDTCHYMDENAIAPLWKGQRFPMSVCISGWTMLNRTPAVIPNIYLDSRIPHDAYRPTFVKSLVMVPIRSTDPIGAIGNYWATRHRATEGEIALLQALADSTALAMENVAVHEDLERVVADRTAQLFATNHHLAALSLVDDLTGLLNRRGFLILSEVEARLFQKQGESIVLAFVDVDGLKRLNDTIGHEAGDELLQLVATGVRNVCRESDLVARFGGDEFVALLSEFDGSVERIIYRLRRAVSATGFDAFGERPSVSIGLAVLDPDNERSIDDLVAEADAAMYADKRARLLSY